MAHVVIEPTPAREKEGQTAWLLQLESTFGRALRVGIVCNERARSHAQTVEELLAGNAGFSARVFGECLETNAPDLASFGADVIVACVDRTHPSMTGHRFREFWSRLADRPIVLIPSNFQDVDFLEYSQRTAIDFLLPPIRREDLILRLRMLGLTTLQADQIRARLKEKIGLQLIIGESAALQREVRRLPRIAECDAPVLIGGESGTGKELVARAIHYLGRRSGSPFIPVNCGAIPEALVESELFGRKRGAYTGAVTDQAGVIHEADGGTLFLDEVDSLPHSAQVKLLRFLQEGEYRVVGSPQVHRANVRIIAASNADLEALVAEGTLRKDIYYRLNVLHLTLPALRERYGDVVLLARHFLEKHALLSNQPLKTLSPAAEQRLNAWHWPGNVRELENVLTRAHFLSDRMVLDPEDLQLPDEPDTIANSFGALKARVVQRFEREYLENLLCAHRGNITQAARAAQKNRRAFFELMRKYGLRGGEDKRVSENGK
jgi:two-component system, NtrC family, response regulator GlrR